MSGKLAPRSLGFAFATAAAFFYLGCVLIMSLAGHDTLVVFLNGLLHGLDVSEIVLPRLDFWPTVFGLINTFVLSWLFGALVAVVYNGSVRRRSRRR